MRYFIYCRKSSEAEDRQVLSIESQLTTLKRTFEGNSDIEIVSIFEESFSAKAPGRTIFNRMVAGIENGEADGIVAWTPDRLARNSIDGGRLVYLLDRGILKDLKFATYTFENNSQGKFMLQIMFGQSKYYSDALSENVKRGNRTKLEKGWRPSHAPLGYLNDQESKTIVADPVHFPLIRRMYELMLTGAYSPKSIAITARDEWGFRTPKRKRIGGTPLAVSTVYRILTNPFYAGIIVWDGEMYAGRHPAVVSVDEFKQIGQLLKRPGQARPQKHRFAFTGMIRCGGCGLMVTAEHKIKRSGRGYTYYHCTRRKLGPRCSEPAVTLAELETEIVRFLESLTIPEGIHQWILKQVTQSSRESTDATSAQRLSLTKSIAELTQQLSELTGLRLRNLIADDEFLSRRQLLQTEKLHLTKQLEAPTPVVRLEPAELLASFSNSAVFCFKNGDTRTKRLILETIGSNPSLTGKKLNVQAVKPFFSNGETVDFNTELGFLEDVLTYAMQNDPHSTKVFRALKMLQSPTAIGTKQTA